MHINVYSKDLKYTTPVSVVKAEKDGVRYVGIRLDLQDGNIVTFWERSETNIIGPVLNRAGDLALENYLDRNRGELDPKDPEER